MTTVAMLFRRVLLGRRYICRRGHPHATPEARDRCGVLPVTLKITSVVRGQPRPFHDGEAES